MRKYCLTQCSMKLLNVLLKAGNHAGWCYEEAVGNSELLIIGDIQGESKKIKKANRLGIKTISITDILAKGLFYVEKQK